MTHVAGRCFLELLSRLCSQQKNTEQWRKQCLFLEEIFTVYMYKYIKRYTIYIDMHPTNLQMGGCSIENVC